MNYFTSKHIGFWSSLIPSIKGGLFNRKLDRFKHLFALDGSDQKKSARISYDYIQFRVENSYMYQIALNVTLILTFALLPILPLLMIWSIFQISEIICYWAAGRIEIEIRNDSFNVKFWHWFKYFSTFIQFFMSAIAFAMFTYIVEDASSLPIGSCYLMVVILSSSLNFFSPKFNIINLVWQLFAFVLFASYFAWESGAPYTFVDDSFLLVPICLAFFTSHVAVWSYNQYYMASLEKEMENYIVQEKLIANTRVLTREKHLIDRIQSTIGEAIVVVDYRFMILQANPSFLRMFDIEGFQSGTISLDEIIDPSLLHSDSIKRSFQPNNDNHYIIQGSPLFVEGEAGLTLFLILDVSEKVKSDQSITQSQKLNALGALSGGIAHDFNNVIAVILANADLIKSCNDIDEIKSQYLQDIFTSCENATGLTRQILSFVRNVPLKSDRESPKALVENTIQMVQNSLEPTHKIVVDSKSNSVVFCDKNLFKNALINLILNARDAIPKGGEIGVKIYDENNYVIFSVVDNGEGIRPDDLERVTEPFFTLKPNEKGTGIGLSIVKQFAEKSNGELRIFSEFGIGTQAQILLPAISGAIRSDLDVTANQNAALNRNAFKILVVDDNVMLAKSLQKQLNIMGHDSQISHSLDEYITQTNKETFDLILCDMVLKTETGIDIWDYSQEQNIPSRFLYMSGNISPELSESLAEKGAYRLLEKPIKFTDLRQEIYDVMGVSAS